MTTFGYFLRWRVFLAILLAIVATGLTTQSSIGADLPNIVWLTSEDNGPHLGCYGDTYATTPHLDELARHGMIFARHWSNAPVCAPARTTIISGMYATSLGAQHMRSMVPLPKGALMYPQYLRQAGYYCTNNSKQDYNLKTVGMVWDESSRKAHWENAPQGKPFFAIFNSTVSHESQIRRRPHELVHDPKTVPIPAYHPDTPEVRYDWAQYHDKITEMDSQLGKRLQELKTAGHLDDTIIFYYGDHGSGMPRSKRWPYNSGLHVPLILYIPDKFAALKPADYQAGGKSARLTAFVDLAPTVLSLAGIKPPEHMQGQAFLGRHATESKKYLFGYRGRMDERFDLVRSITDGKYVYIRNYMPHKIYGQYLNYMFQTPTTRVWRKQFDEGNLRPPQTFFWQQKPAEELYDLNRDPDEVNNLSDDPKFAQKKSELHQALYRHLLDSRDTGFLCEAEMHFRTGDQSPYDMARNNNGAAYPIKKILAAAEIATNPKPGDDQKLLAFFKDSDAAVRYWGCIGFQVRGSEFAKRHLEYAQKLQKDTSGSVRLLAAQIAATYGQEADIKSAMPILLEAADPDRHSVYLSIAALNAIDELGEIARPYRKQIQALPRTVSTGKSRVSGYGGRLLERIEQQFKID